MGLFSGIDTSSIDTTVRRSPVQDTYELERIVALPRRTLDLDTGTINGSPIPDLNLLYLKNADRCSEYPSCPLCKSGPVRMWPTQSAALFEAEAAWGLLGLMGVGAGKTLVTLLLPDVFGVDRAVILVPASLRDQLKTRDIPAYSRHFEIPVDKIKIIAYSEISVESGQNALDSYKPQLIIADECHSLARYTSTRTKRFLRYMRENPSTRFCGLSGTVTRKSLRDYGHLAELALRNRSPLPSHWGDLQEWADCLDVPDPKRGVVPPGALKKLATSPQQAFKIAHTKNMQDAVEEARLAFRQRLIDTEGVVATSLSWEAASLYIKRIEVDPPPSVTSIQAQFNTSWELGVVVAEDGARFYETSRQISLGFYYEWDWPNGPDIEWLEPRSQWSKAVREFLKRSRKGMDSPLLVAKAAQKGELGHEFSNLWAAWAAVKDRYKPHPPIKTNWIDTYAIEFAEDWEIARKRKKERGIIWYSHEAIEVKLAEAGIPVYGAGTDAGTAKDDVIACSIRAQGTGKNLQRYNHNLVLEAPSSGLTWEQMLGRTHRPGQEADEVWFDVFVPTSFFDEALQKAVEDAVYVQQTQGQKQKILTATRVGW